MTRFLLDTYRILSVECCATCRHVAKWCGGHPTCERGARGAFVGPDVDPLGLCDEYERPQ